MTACGRTNLTTNPPQQNNQSSSVSSTPKTYTQNSTNATSSKSDPGTNNIKNIKGFTTIENQSFMVDLNSWGNVKFVSGKITGGNHIPVVFYLTSENGDILYSFEDTPFPYNVDVKAVSFQDVNKDGLKDIIIIVIDNANFGKPISAVWLQNDDKKFTCNTKLSQEMNESGNNNDIKTVTYYLSKKF